MLRSCSSVFTVFVFSVVFLCFAPCASMIITSFPEFPNLRLRTNLDSPSITIGNALRVWLTKVLTKCSIIHTEKTKLNAKTESTQFGPPSCLCTSTSSSPRQGTHVSSWYHNMKIYFWNWSLSLSYIFLMFNIFFNIFGIFYIHSWMSTGRLSFVQFILV